MVWEVEQKFRSPNPEAVLTFLKTAGAVAQPVEHQTDTYFAHPQRDFAETNEALRTRRLDQDGRIARFECTYKGPRLPGPTKTRQEWNSTIDRDDADSFHRTLTALGFREVATVAKTRRPFRLRWRERDYSICLDHIDRLGNFLEVETLVEHDHELEAARTELPELAEQLAAGELVTASYLRLVLALGGDETAPRD